MRSRSVFLVFPRFELESPLRSHTPPRTKNERCFSTSVPKLHEFITDPRLEHEQLLPHYPDHDSDETRTVTIIEANKCAFKIQLARDPCRALDVYKKCWASKRSLGMRWYARIFRKQHRAQSNANITHPLASVLDLLILGSFIFTSVLFYSFIVPTSEVPSEVER